jgi:hypothetical protein
MPHSIIIPGDACLAYFNKIWGILESMVAKRLGQSRPDSTDVLYQMLFEELEQRGLKGTPEYRNVMFRAHQHAEWLAGLARLSSPVT